MKGGRRGGGRRGVRGIRGSCQEVQCTRENWGREREMGATTGSVV